MRIKQLIILFFVDVALVVAFLLKDKLQNNFKEEVIYNEEYITITLKGEVNLEGEISVPKAWTVGTALDLIGLTEYADTSTINKKETVREGAIYTVGRLKGTIENLININTASIDELKLLSGIGESIAKKIVDYRNSSSFKSIEEIKKVSGIGDSLYEKIKDKITC